MSLQYLNTYSRLPETNLFPPVLRRLVLSPELRFQIKRQILKHGKRDFTTSLPRIIIIHILDNYLLFLLVGCSFTGSVRIVRSHNSLFTLCGIRSVSEFVLLTVCSEIWGYKEV